MNAAPADINLPDIPNHWTVRPIKYVGRLVTGGTPPTSDSTHYSDGEAKGFPWFRPEDLDDSGRPSIASRFLTKSGLATVPRLPPKSVQVVSIGATLGKIGYVDTEAASNQQINAVVGAACPKFVFYCLTASRDRIWASSMGNTIPIISAGRLGAVKIPVPPVDEQNAIADFLDAETAKVDALIAKQEQLIATLREDRTATITHAVTKGLDLAVTMKSSGVEWLGEVPDHWDTAVMKRLASRITDGAHVSPETENGEYDFVSTKDVTERGIDFANCLRTSPRSYEELVRYGCQPEVGDVLFSKDGTVGRTVVVDECRAFVVASSLIIIKPLAVITDPYFLHYVAQAANVRQQVESFVKGAGLPRLSISNLRKIVVAVPPLREQQDIVSFLNERCGRIDTLIEKAHDVIKTLREFRSALITDAVTGKIDVRRAA